jgi:hypothetical protein
MTNMNEIEWLSATLAGSIVGAVTLYGLLRVAFAIRDRKYK